MPDVINEAPCYYCTQFHFPWFCQAFPKGEGIPQEIRDGEHDHQSPYPGDGGVLFKSTMLEEGEK